MIRGPLLTVFATLVIAVPGVAQDSATFRLGDRILAVVGDNLLLESEWLEQTLILTDQLGLDRSSPEFEQIAIQAFDQMLRNLIIVTVAEQDTMIQLDNEIIAEQVEAEIEQIRSRFPNEAEFQRELRRSQWGSLAGYRADIQERKRRESLGQAFLELRRDEIKIPVVTDADVRAYWDENRAAFGSRPENFRFEEIAVTIRPNEQAKAAALEEAERVLADIEAGLDFGSAAEEFSDDPGSAEDRGDLGWFGRGRMVPSFEAAAFESTPGEIVGPIESPFGYHLIQVIDQRPEERRARHILLGFERSAEDQARAQSEARSLADAIVLGADVDSLQAIYMPDDESAAEILEFPAGQLPAQYLRALSRLEEGSTTVIETSTGFSVLVSRGRSGGGEATFEELAPRIREQLEQEQAEDAFVENLRRRVHVDVRVPPERALTEI